MILRAAGQVGETHMLVSTDPASNIDQVFGKTGIDGLGALTHAAAAETWPGGPAPA